MIEECANHFFSLGCEKLDMSSRAFSRAELVSPYRSQKGPRGPVNTGDGIPGEIYLREHIPKENQTKVFYDNISDQLGNCISSTDFVDRASEHANTHTSQAGN